MTALVVRGQRPIQVRPRQLLDIKAKVHTAVARRHQLRSEGFHIEKWYIVRGII